MGLIPFLSPISIVYQNDWGTACNFAAGPKPNGRLTESTYPTNKTAFNAEKHSVNLCAQFRRRHGGLHQALIVFGAMGGICVTVTLATTTIGEYLTFIVMGVMAYILYFLFGDANMHRHQVTGARLFQDLHVWFTLSFLAVMWSFY